MKIARYGGLEDEGWTDLCSVTRTLVWGLIRAPFWVALFGLLGAVAGGVFILIPLVAVVAYLLEGLSFQFVVWFVLAVWCIAAWAAYEVYAQAEDKVSPIASVARFTKASYRSWKDKTCVLVDIE